MVTLKLNESFHNLIVGAIISLRLQSADGSRKKEPEEGEIHETTIRPSEMASGSPQVSAILTQPVVPQAIGTASISALAS